MRTTICTWSSLAMICGLCVTAQVAIAADTAVISDIADLQQTFYSSHGESVPEGADLLSVINSPQLNAQFALIDQDEGVGNRATISQTGSDNAAAILQGFGDDNLANLTQVGNTNYAAVTQSGASNHVDQLTQQGNNNYALVNQYNGNNALTLNQTYDYNRAQIDQYGGTTLSVTQSNPGGTASSVNELTLKAYAEPGASSTFAPVQLSGAGQTQIVLCNGSAAYCTQVSPN